MEFDNSPNFPNLPLTQIIAATVERGTSKNRTSFERV